MSHTNYKIEELASLKQEKYELKDQIENLKFKNL